MSIIPRFRQSIKPGKVTLYLPGSYKAQAPARGKTTDSRDDKDDSCRKCMRLIELAFGPDDAATGQNYTNKTLAAGIVSSLTSTAKQEKSEAAAARDVSEENAILKALKEIDDIPLSPDADLTHDLLATHNKVLRAYLGLHTSRELFNQAMEACHYYYIVNGFETSNPILHTYIGIGRTDSLPAEYEAETAEEPMEEAEYLAAVNQDAKEQQSRVDEIRAYLSQVLVAEPNRNVEETSTDEAPNCSFSTSVNDHNKPDMYRAYLGESYVQLSEGEVEALRRMEDIYKNSDAVDRAKRSKAQYLSLINNEGRWSWNGIDWEKMRAEDNLAFSSQFDGNAVPDYTTKDQENREDAREMTEISEQSEEIHKISVLKSHNEEQDVSNVNKTSEKFIPESEQEGKSQQPNLEALTMEEHFAKMGLMPCHMYIAPKFKESSSEMAKQTTKSAANGVVLPMYIYLQPLKSLNLETGGKGNSEGVPDDHTMHTHPAEAQEPKQEITYRLQAFLSGQMKDQNVVEDTEQADVEAHKQERMALSYSKPLRLELVLSIKPLTPLDNESTPQGTESKPTDQYHKKGGDLKNQSNFHSESKSADQMSAVSLYDEPTEQTIREKHFLNTNCTEYYDGSLNYWNLNETQENEAKVKADRREGLENEFGSMSSDDLVTPGQTATEAKAEQSLLSNIEHKDVAISYYSNTPRAEGQVTPEVDYSVSDQSDGTKREDEATKAGQAQFPLSSLVQPAVDIPDDVPDHRPKPMTEKPKPKRDAEIPDPYIRDVQLSEMLQTLRTRNRLKQLQECAIKLSRCSPRPPPCNRSSGGCLPPRPPCSQPGTVIRPPGPRIQVSQKPKSNPCKKCVSVSDPLATTMLRRKSKLVGVIPSKPKSLHEGEAKARETPEKGRIIAPGWSTRRGKPSSGIPVRKKFSLSDLIGRYTF